MTVIESILKSFGVALLVLAIPAPAEENPLDLFRGFAFSDPSFSKALEILVDSRFADISSQCNGRITLASQTPVNYYDTASSSTLYYAPYSGSKTAIYNGSRWVLFNHGEVSLALSTAANRNYDVFLYSNAGTPTLELSAAWTNDTTRADALTLVNGVRVKSSNNTRRYLGTIRTIAVNTATDTQRQRFVWSECNPLQRQTKIYNPGFDGQYDTNFTYFNNDTTFQAEAVVGISSAYLSRASVCFVGSGSAPLYLGIGVDSSTVPTVKFQRDDAIFSCGDVAVGGTFTQGYHTLVLGVGTDLTGLADFYTPKMDGWIFN